MESRIRRAGVAMMVTGVLLAWYLPDLLWRTGHVPAVWMLTAVDSIGVFVVVPIGAGLVAAAVVLQKLQGAPSLFGRHQLTVGVALIAVGLVCRIAGSSLTAGVTEHLDPTGAAGASLVALVVDLGTYAALPLGVALTATWPISYLHDRTRVSSSPIVARRVDPRDTTWEINDPPYRVYYFEPTEDVADGRVESVRTDEWLLEGVSDVSEAIGWANDHRRGRRYEMYVEASHHGPGLLRLHGQDPNHRD